MKPKAKLKAKPWDVVEHLKTERDMAGYLEAAFEDGDPTLIAAALGDVARAKGMMEISRQTGVSRAVLARTFSANGKPEFATMLKVIHALGIKLKASAI